jgi:hypothetical protein
LLGISGIWKRFMPGYFSSVLRAYFKAASAPISSFPLRKLILVSFLEAEICFPFLFMPIEKLSINFRAISSSLTVSGLLSSRSKPLAILSSISTREMPFGLTFSPSSLGNSGIYSPVLPFFHSSNSTKSASRRLMFSKKDLTSSFRLFSSL